MTSYPHHASKLGFGVVQHSIPQEAKRESEGVWGLAVGTGHLSGYKHSKQAATVTSPNAVEVHVGHLSHMKTPAPPMGEQNNGVLLCIIMTRLFKMDQSGYYRYVIHEKWDFKS